MGMSEQTSLPQMPKKHAEPALLEPTALLAHRRRRGQGPSGKAPAGALMVFQSQLLRTIVKRYRGKPIKGFFGEAFRLRRTNGRVLVVGNFGVGAPAAATILEDLIAFGLREVVALGVAGGLDSELAPGTAILVKEALRDEGTSHHYLPSAPFIQASSGLRQRLAARLQDATIPYRDGKSWTTDAPYRETLAEATQFRQLGCLAVEMEQAALFAVGHYRKIDVAGTLIIADSLHEDRWRLDFPWPVVQDRLEMVADAALGLWNE